VIHFIFLLVAATCKLAPRAGVAFFECLNEFSTHCGEQHYEGRAQNILQNMLTKFLFIGELRVHEYVRTVVKEKRCRVGDSRILNKDRSRVRKIVRSWAGMQIRW